MPTRREFLIGGLTVGLGVAIGEGINHKNRIYPQSPEAQNLSPVFIDDYIEQISEGVNIRTSPHIPDKTRLHHPSNSIAWADIAQVNGVDLQGRKAFLISHPPIVTGHDAEGIEDHGYWIKLDVKRKGDLFPTPYYVSTSWETKGNVASLGADGVNDIKILPDGSYRAFDGTKFAASDIGKVFVPQNEATAAREILPVIWSVKARGKLDGTSPLKPDGKIPLPDGTSEPYYGERIINELIIRPSGTENDIEEGLMDGTIPINVRNFPDTEYGNGEPVELIGKIPQGTIIRNVLVSQDYFLAFRMRDIQGSLVEINNNSLQPITPDTICAVHYSYVDATPNTDLQGLPHS